MIHLKKAFGEGVPRNLNARLSMTTAMHGSLPPALGHEQGPHPHGLPLGPTWPRWPHVR